MAHEREEYLEDARTDFICDCCGERYEDGDRYYIDGKVICTNDECVEYAFTLIAEPVKKECDCSVCGDPSAIPCKNYWLYDNEIFCRHCLTELLDENYRGSSWS